MQESRNNHRVLYKNVIKKINDSKLDPNEDSIYFKLISRMHSILSKKEPDYDYIQKRIYENITSGKTDRKNIFHKSYFTYAAGFVILLIVALNCYEYIIDRFVSPQTHEVINKISQIPNRHKAILIINDSCRVDIDNDSVIYDKNSQNKSLFNKIALLNFPDKSEIQMHKLVIPKGGEMYLVLPDGTEVYLNSNTKLRYPTKFSLEKREVYLEKGEAFFSVKPSNIPFLVVSNISITKVSGTEFNVKSDSLINQITLCKGSVEIENLSTRTKKIIYPDEQATVFEQKIDVETVDTYEIRAWTEGKFFFQEKKSD